MTYGQRLRVIVSDLRSCTFAIRPVLAHFSDSSCSACQPVIHIVPSA